MRHRTLGRLLAAAALVAAAAGVGVPAPAVAAGCSSAEGVTVVVDFNELGGGVPSVCVSDGGGKKASTLFPGAGFPLSYAQRQPGFVCRVSGVPASDPCVNTAPANAYWGLWWSDGKTGKWSYSSLGAGSLSVPEGGYVAFSWDQGDGSATPSFTPAAHRNDPTPTPTPTPSPTSKPTRTPSPGPGTSSGPSPGDSPSDGQSVTPAASPTASPTTTSAPAAPGSNGASPTATASETSASPTPGAEPTDGPTDAATDGASADESVEPDAAEPESDGLPSYVAPSLIAALFGAAGVVFLVRRRTGSP